MGKKITLLGHFTVGGKEHAGQLLIDGEKSNLEIYGDEFLHISTEDMRRVVGISKDGQSITCVNCIGAGISGTATYYGKQRHSMSLFPNFVLIGPRQPDPEQPEFSELVFSFTRANMLFYDWGTFGHIIYEHPLSFGQKREILRYVRKAPKRRRRGGHLDLLFHWDRGPIVEIKNAIGTITAETATSQSLPSASGIHLHAQVRIRLSFASPQTLEEALRFQFIIMEFFELVSQSKQNVTHIELTHKDAEREIPLRLHISHSDQDDVEELQPTDALLNGGLHSEEFERTLSRWLDTHYERSAARRRFGDGFRNSRSYNADRLVGAANAFDLLPKSDFSSLPCIPSEVKGLVSMLEAQVENATKSNETIASHKGQLMGALGRTRATNMRSKVLARYRGLPDVLKTRLPEMETMIGYAVQARHFFVHGAETRLSAEELYRHAPFFTDTLEFVFATSELQACGWNIERWAKESFSGSRLKWYIHNYSEHVKQVNSSLGSAP
jgi:hypothetical protein